MSKGNWLRLLLLAAIWGGSFIFMRVLSPTLGPVVTTTVRILGAGIVMQIGFSLLRVNTEWRRWWWHYLVIGLLNAAIPFCLFAYAAHFLPASYSAIINAGTPLFGALFAVILLNESLSLRKFASLMLGVSGVALLSYHGQTHHQDMPHFYSAIAACVGATACYGLASIYIRKLMIGVQPIALAGSSQLIGGLLLLPFALYTLPELAAVQALGWNTLIFNALGLSLLCSAVAFILYFKLLQEIGAQALTVTLLIPLFGLLWSWLFLDESITLTMLLGCALVLTSTRLVTQAASSSSKK